MGIRFIIAGTIILAFSTFTNAVDVTAQDKINIVKKVYVGLLKDDLGEEEVIRRYGDQGFRQILRKLEAISDQNEGDQCEWQTAGVLIPGQDHDVRANQIKYSILQNGRVRAQAQNFGEYFKVDFDVICTALNCSITDIFTPQSYKTELASYASQGTC